MSKDIHAETAALIFGKPEDELTEDERKAGRTVNFGTRFGANLGTPEEIADFRAKRQEASSVFYREMYGPPPRTFLVPEPRTDTGRIGAVPTGQSLFDEHGFQTLRGRNDVRGSIDEANHLKNDRRYVGPPPRKTFNTSHVETLIQEFLELPRKRAERGLRSALSRMGVVGLALREPS